MWRALIAATWLASLAAQDQPATALRSPDWRVRNDAAAALAALPDAQLDVGALVSVLREPWQGPEISEVRYGGRGGRGSTDPLDRVVREAAEVVSGWRRAGQWPDDGVANLRRLVVPWHPHELSSWLLRERAALYPAIAKALDGVPLGNVHLAGLWLRAAWPGEAAVRRRADDGSDLVALAGALWQYEPQGGELLTHLLAGDSLPWRRTVIDLGDVGLLANEAARQAVVTQFFGDDRAGQGQAGWLLLQLGADAVPLVVPALAEERRRARALAVLCTLGERAAGLGDELLPLFKADGADSVQRTLAVVARAPIAPKARPALAAAATAILKGGRSIPTRILAVDALANLGAGVDAELRKELRRMLDDPPTPGVRARLLGCLRRLGVPLDLPTTRKLELCTMLHASTDTWLAAADDGEPALAGLATRLADRQHARWRGPCLDRLVQVAPEAVVASLTHADSWLRSAAVASLRPVDAALVPTVRIEPLLSDPDPAIRRLALTWIAERADVAASRAAVLAAVPSLASLLTRDLVAGLFRKLEVPLVDQLAVLVAPLRQGECWDLLVGDDAAVRREAARRWLAAATDERDRALLLGELVRLGLGGEDEIAWVRAALRGPQAVLLGTPFVAAGSLPTTLRADLEALVDAALVARDPMSDAAQLGVAARDALLKHFRR
ncbi:MAG: hypothetical protein WAT39_26395 [Planctomycetota bacterium]